MLSSLSVDIKLQIFYISYNISSLLWGVLLKLYPSAAAPALLSHFRTHCSFLVFSLVTAGQTSALHQHTSSTFSSTMKIDLFGVYYKHSNNSDWKDELKTHGSKCLGQTQHHAKYNEDNNNCILINNNNNNYNNAYVLQLCWINHGELLYRNWYFCLG